MKGALGRGTEKLKNMAVSCPASFSHPEQWEPALNSIHGASPSKGVHGAGWPSRMEAMQE